MPIPLLLPCSEAFLNNQESNYLGKLTKVLGYESSFQKCKRIEAVFSPSPVYRGSEFPRIPYPVCIPIITRGDNFTRAPTTFTAFPELGNLSCLQKPNKRLVAFLVEDSVAEEEVSPIVDAGYKVIHFKEGYFEEVAFPLVETLREFEWTLRNDHTGFQDRQDLANACNFLNLDKRVYVWDDGFGIVELKYDILASEAPKCEGDPGYFRFENKLGIRDPNDELGISFGGALRKSETTSLSDVFSHDSDAFWVIRFGSENSEIKWNELETDGDKSKERRIEILIPQQDLGPSDVLSFGLMWSKRKLYRIHDDSSVFRALHNYQRLRHSLRFMRRPRNSVWQFKKGPLLERFGPYENNLGYLDSEGVYEENFHHYGFTWDVIKVTRGSLFKMTWTLDQGR